MNTSKLSQGEMIAGAGGVLLLISLFLSWVSAPAGFGSLSAFDAFSGMDIIMLIVAIVAIAWVAVRVVETGVAVPPNANWIVGLLGVAVLGWVVGWCLEEGSAGIGAWLALVASIAIIWGALGAPTRPAVRRPVASTTTGAGTAPPSPTAPGSVGTTSPGGPPPSTGGAPGGPPPPGGPSA